MIKKILSFLKKLLIFFRYVFLKVTKVKIKRGHIIPHNCEIWYVNLVEKECGVCVPFTVKKRNWYGKVVGEQKKIVEAPNCLYYKALNQVNGERKAKTILDKFYENVR